MPKGLSFLPMPKRIATQSGSFKLPEVVHIVLPSGAATFGAERFIARAPVGTWRLRRGPSLMPLEELRIDINDTVAHAQGYHLQISLDGLTLTARSDAGVFYGLQTLEQVLRANGAKLPVLDIEDWPDFERRGVYHDCARGKVPKRETLLQLVEDLASLKVNEFQLYVENAFEFRKHPGMYDDTTPLTPEDILAVDAACRERFIDFVPSLTSLGHFEKILGRPQYRHLGEIEPEDLRKQGMDIWWNTPWTLCVTDDGARQLLKDMYDEFVPNFTSSIFNICCDESWDLGKGRSKALLDKIGQGQMYVDWVNYCDGLAKGHGRRIQMWGDIILNHPDLINQLPRNATLLEWGYESHHQFEEHCALFQQRGEGRPYYVCPGTSTWATLAGRTRNSFGNMHNAARAGLKYEAAGFLNTDWGDGGHQHLLAVSLLPFAYGAAVSWDCDAMHDPSIPQKPDWSTGIVPEGSKADDKKLKPFLDAAAIHFFRDSTGAAAHIAYEIGLLYERFGWQRFNGSLDYYLFREKFDFANYVNRAETKGLDRVQADAESLLKQLKTVKLDRSDAAQIVNELAHTCRVIVHTCKRTRLRKAWLAADPAKRNPEHEKLRALPPQALPKTFKRDMAALKKEATALRAEFRKLWLNRNKPSRHADVDAEFARLITEYASFAR